MLGCTFCTRANSQCTEQLQWIFNYLKYLDTWRGHNYLFSWPIFTARRVKLQGNIFTSVCDSFCSLGGGVMLWVLFYDGQHPIKQHTYSPGQYIPPWTAHTAWTAHPLTAPLPFDNTLRPGQQLPEHAATYHWLLIELPYWFKSCFSLKMLEILTKQYTKIILWQVMRSEIQPTRGDFEPPRKIFHSSIFAFCSLHCILKTPHLGFRLSIVFFCKASFRSN